MKINLNRNLDRDRLTIFARGIELPRTYRLDRLFIQTHAQRFDDLDASRHSIFANYQADNAGALKMFSPRLIGELRIRVVEHPRRSDTIADLVHGRLAGRPLRVRRRLILGANAERRREKQRGVQSNAKLP